MIRWLAKLQDINQRWLYAAALVLLIVPFVVLIPMPRGSVSAATRGLFDTLDACPPDKVVLIDSSWDMGSQAENRAQLQCVVRHLCSRRIRFVVTSLGVTPFAATFADGVIAPIAAKAGYVYGRDWVNCGYVPPGGSFGAVVQTLCEDFHRVRPADVNGTPAEQLPLLERVRSAADVHAIYVITYAPAPEWISFARGQFGTPVGFGCMSIMAPEYYKYLDSGQLCGVLIGNRGAAEYEVLTKTPALGTRLIMVASFGNCIILAAAVIGNVGMWAGRRVRRRQR